MKKYMTFYWVLEGGSWSIRNTIEEAKNEWCFGMMVFEIEATDEDALLEYCKEVKSNRLIIEKLKEKYGIIYQEGEPYDWLITK